MKKKQIILTIAILVIMVLLCACGAKSESWDLSIVDSNGNGIEGVKVQVCTNQLCKLADTDSSGKVNIEIDGNECEISILSCPSEFECPNDSYEVTKGVNTTIILYAAQADSGSKDTVTSEQTEAAGQEDALTDKSNRTKIVFSSVDTNGNAVDDSIFGQNKVTMVNLWEPWCGPCKSEMPDLEKLYQEYKNEGFMILGIYEYEDGLQEVLESTGVSYPIVKTTESFLNILDVTGAYPTTFFVDSEGYIILPSEADVLAMEQETMQNYLANIEAYKNGELDAYKAYPQYSSYFEFLEKADADHDYLESVVKEEVASGYASGYTIGSMNYDSWKEIIENNLRHE